MVIKLVLHTPDLSKLSQVATRSVRCGFFKEAYSIVPYPAELLGYIICIEFFPSQGLVFLKTSVIIFV